MSYNINEQMLKEARDSKNPKKDLAKYFLSEFQRNSKNNDKTVDDETAVKILKSFKKDIEEQESYYSSTEYEEHKKTIEFLDKFLPSEPNEENIRNVLNQIDFSQLKSKKQAVGIVKKYFNGNVDGKLVSDIIENEY